MLITKDPIESDLFFKSLSSATCGAIATFSGIVRCENHGKKVEKIFYDCFEALAKKELKEISNEASSKFKIEKVFVSHRIGMVRVGESAIMIGVASRHRKDSLKACEYVIEEVKKRVAIWKKEYYVDGEFSWIENCCA